MTPGADPLANLKPIHLPAEPGWWPPAPGWWLLALSVVVLAIGMVLAWRHWQRRRAPVRQADAELARISAETDAVRQLTALNQLLRRVAARVYGPGAASLAPAQWSDFLTTHAPAGDQNPLRWQQLAQAPYRGIDASDDTLSIDALGMTRAWIQANLKRARPC